MKLFSNVWVHPRTSAAGILISVATVAGVLAQHGVTLGVIGGGSVVSLAGALATAVLGLMARDPGAPPPQPVPAAPPCNGPCSTSSNKSNTTAKLSAWMLIALLVPLPWLQGCTGNQVAQDIVNWTPSLESAVATVNSAASLIAPADLPVFTAATADFKTASNLLVTQARAYLANPSASTLAQLQNQVIAFQQHVNAALLAAAHIVDAASQQRAITALQAVATVVTAILALVQSVSSKADVARMAAAAPIKQAAVEPYLNAGAAAALVAIHYNEALPLAQAQIAAAQSAQLNAGF